MSLEKILRKALVGATIITTTYISGCGETKPEPAVTLKDGTVYVREHARVENPITAINTQQGPINIFMGQYKAKLGKDGLMEVEGGAQTNQPSAGQVSRQGASASPARVAPSPQASPAYDPCQNYIRHDIEGVEFIFETPDARDDYLKFVELFNQHNGTPFRREDRRINWLRWRKHFQDYADSFSAPPVYCNGIPVIDRDAALSITRWYESKISEQPSQQLTREPALQAPLQAPPAPACPPASSESLDSFVQPNQSRGPFHSGQRGFGSGFGVRIYGDWLGRRATPSYRTGRGANYWSPQAVY